MGYVICSGWWSDGHKKNVTQGREYAQEQMSPSFFEEDWMRCVRRFLRPEKILVTDSASPSKLPEIHGVEIVEMTRNFLHASVCDSKLCGWSRGFLMGAFYALMNDLDYVYLEQDVMFWGDIVGRAFGELGCADYSHGLWDHSLKVEQSFVVMRNAVIMDFICGYLGVRRSDRDLRPELKFYRLSRTMNFKELSFGYGRRRPIDFTNDCFYFQQSSPEELRRMRSMYEY